MENENKNTAKTAISNTIANMFTLVFGMVMIPVITSILSTDDMGISSTFVNTRNIFAIIVSLASTSYVYKGLLVYSEKKEEYIYNLVIFNVVAVILAFLVCLPFKTQLMRLLSLDDFLFYWLFLSELCYSLFLIADYYCIFYNKSLIVFFIVLSVGPISQVLSVVLAFLIPDYKYIGRVVGLDATYLIVSLIMLLWILKIKNKHIKAEYLKRALSFTVPIIPHLLSQMVLTQCDLLMISYFTGSSNTGIYSMAHTVGFLAYTVMTQILSVWSTWHLRRLVEKDYAAVKSSSTVMVLLGLYLTIGLLTIEPELITWFLNDEYQPCIYIIPPLVLAMYFQIVYLFFYDIEYYHGLSKKIATSSVVAAVLNIILNVVFIPLFGYIAAGYTTVASYVVLLLLNVYFCRGYEVSKQYNLKFMALSCVMVTLYIVFIFMTVDTMIIRYIVLVAITVFILLLKGKDLLNIVRTLR